MNNSRISRVAAVALVATTFSVGAFAKDGYDVPESWPSPMMEHSFGKFLVDRLEYVWTDSDQEAVNWDFQGWYGGDYNRVYIKGEGGNVLGDDEDAEFESLDLLFSRFFANFWAIQAGIGYQGGIGSDNRPERTFVVLGLQGTAPYRFEVDAALRISDEGDVSADLEMEYDFRLTQRSYLQPRMEVAVAASEARAFGVGEGLNSVRFGLRLRYEIRREFAPYIGAYWERQFGETADMTRAAGGDTESSGIVAGVRMWF